MNDVMKMEKTAVNTSTDKNAAVNRFLDSLIPEDMKGRETFRTKMEKLILTGKLDDRGPSYRRLRTHRKERWHSLHSG